MIYDRNHPRLVEMRKEIRRITDKKLALLKEAVRRRGIKEKEAMDPHREAMNGIQEELYRHACEDFENRWGHSPNTYAPINDGGKEKKCLQGMRDYLIARDNRLMAQDYSVRDSHEGCEDALRNLWIMINDGLGISVD